MATKRILEDQEYTGADVDADLEQPPPENPDIPDIEQVGDLEAEGGTD